MGKTVSNPKPRQGNHLYVRVCSNSTFLTNIPIQNNARGILVNISSFTAERNISHKSILKYQGMRDEFKIYLMKISIHHYQHLAN